MSRAVLAVGMCALLAACGGRDPLAQLTHQPDPYAEKRAFDRDRAIEAHLKTHALTPVEGIWAFENKLYEVVVYRVEAPGEKSKYPGYDYIARITDSPQDQDMRSDVKMLLRQSPDGTGYTGLFLGAQHQRYSAAFVMSKPGVMETSLPSGPYGRMEKWQMLRTYPAAQ